MPADAPPALRWTVERCLAKDPEQRYDSTRDLFRELRQVRDHLTEAHTGIGGGAGRRPSREVYRLTVAVAVLSILLGGVALGRWLAGRKRDAREWTGIQLGGPGIAMRPVVSPDGQMLAFSAMVDDQTQLAVMKPDSGTWTVLTHDRSAGMQAQASWAPDGSRIYFDRVWGAPRGVYAISPLGGEPRLLLDRAQCPRALPDGSLIVTMIDPAARYRLFRLWPDSGRLQPLPALLGGGVSQLVDPLVQAFPDGREVLYLGAPETERNSLPRWNAIDLETLRSRPLNMPAAPGAFGIAVSPDNRSALFVNVEDDEWSIASVPRRGTEPPRALIWFPRPYNVWGLDAARDGSVYFDYMMRQTAVVEFDAAGKPVGETVAAIDSGLIPLGGGRYLCDYRKSRKRQLRVIQAGTGSGNLLLESSDESSGPTAKVGSDSVAFLFGPGGSKHIAIAALREGRILRRFSFDASAVRSIAATPDGDKLYYCDRGQVWVVDAKADEGAKPAAVTTGDSVAIDGSGKYLYVKRTRAEQRALVRIPLAVGPAETLSIPPDYTMSEDTLSPAAVDASGRVLIEVDSADSWFERVAMIDPSRKTFEVIPTGFHGDVWMPAWESNGHIAAIGVRLDSTLWKYSPARSGAK